MGSTVVLIFEGPPETKLHFSEGQKLKLGEEIVTTIPFSQEKTLFE
jgi:hypothetical protein